MRAEMDLLLQATKQEVGFMVLYSSRPEWDRDCILCMEHTLDKQAAKALQANVIAPALKLFAGKSKEKRDQEIYKRAKCKVDEEKYEAERLSLEKHLEAVEKKKTALKRKLDAL